MDPEKIVAFVVARLSDHSWIFIESLRSSKLLFSPIPTSGATGQSSLATVGITPTSEKVPPEAFVYFLLNAALGIVILTLVPRVGSAPALYVEICGVFALDFAYAGVLFGFCKIFGGRGTFAATLACVLQITSTIFVVSALLTILWVIVDRYLMKLEFPYTLLKGPYLALFILQALLQSIYIPSAMVRVHGPGGKHPLLLRISLIAAVLVGLSFAVMLYVAIGFTSL